MRTRFHCNAMCVMFTAIGSLLAGCTSVVGGGGQGQGNGNNGGSQDEGFCDDGALSVVADLAGTSRTRTGTMEYREVNGCKEFFARVQGFDAGTYDVHVSDIVVGKLTVDASGSGELEYDSLTGNFPAGFPTPTGGDSGDVGGLVLGTFAGDCPAVPKICPAGGNGNGNGGGGDGGNSDTVKLTVTLRSKTAGALNMDAFVCLDSEFHTRADAPYNSSAICSRITQTDAETVREFTATKDQKATIIAVEDNNPGTGGGGTGADPASLKSPSAVYFVEWQGSVGEHVEEGVLHLEMNQDRSVIALFDIMPLLRWGKVNENHPEFGGGCFDFDLEPATWLRFPGVEQNEQHATCISGGVNGDTILYGQLKPGTVVTLTAQDFQGSNLTWVGWQGGDCGASRECKITVQAGTDKYNKAVWRSPN